MSWLLLVLSSGLALFTFFLALAMIWRLGASLVTPAQALIEDEGVRLGSSAPELAGYDAETGADAHLTFAGVPTFVVFGTPGCAPCEKTLAIAYRHPALRHARLVFVAGDRTTVGSVLDEAPPWVRDRWELYRFHDETAARKQWRAPVSPYFHFIGHDGRVLAKGVATADAHFDQLLLPVVHSVASHTIPSASAAVLQEESLP